MCFKKKTPVLKRLTTGQEKEQQACEWLSAQGFKILKQNYHCKGGEIDIIAFSPSPKKSLFKKTAHKPTLIFFEIKYRQNSDYGHPSEFVTPKKQQKIQRCAQVFLLKHPKLTHLPMRFDVITYQGNQTTPDWIQNAFGM